LLLLVIGFNNALAQIDPGVRSDPGGAGGSLPGLTTNEKSFFDLGLDSFSEAEGVEEGLGPRFNMDSCAGCHAQPAIGGTSPFVNPQVEVATKNGAMNVLPFLLPSMDRCAKPDSNSNPMGRATAAFTICPRSHADGMPKNVESPNQTSLPQHVITI